MASRHIVKGKRFAPDPHLTTYGQSVWSSPMTDEIGQAVGDRVRAAMRAASVTQMQAAALLGISQPQLSKRLSGEIIFDVAELDIMARLCEVPVASFLTGVPA